MPKEVKTDIERILKEYNNLQADIAKVSASKHMKESTEAMYNSIKRLRGYLASTAQEYGQRVQEENGVHTVKNEEALSLQEEYEQNIQKIKENYDENFKFLLLIKQELQNNLFNLYIEQTDEEYNKILIIEEMKKNREELAFLANQGDLDKLEDRVKQIKEKNQKEQEDMDSNEGRIKQIHKEEEKVLKAIRMCEKAMDECKQNMLSDMEFENVLTNDRFHKINEKYLIVVKEKNIFQKATSWLFNRINGKKRYAEEILSPLKQGIINIKEHKVEAIKERISQQTNEATEKIEQNVNLSNVRIHANDIAKQQYTSIIETAKNYRENAICKLKDILQKSPNEPVIDSMQAELEI